MGTGEVIVPLAGRLNCSLSCDTFRILKAFKHIYENCQTDVVLIFFLKTVPPDYGQL
jgi:hypothetical protein